MAFWEYVVGECHVCNTPVNVDDSKRVIKEDWFFPRYYCEKCYSIMEEQINEITKDFTKKKDDFMRYKVDLDVITLEEAVNLIESVPRLTVFYTYGIGKPIHLLNRDSLATSIKNKAIYLTPAGFVEFN